MGAYEFHTGTKPTVSSFTVTRSSGRVLSLTIVLNTPATMNTLSLFSVAGAAMPYQLAVTGNQTYVLTFPQSLNSAYTGNLLPTGSYGIIIQPIGTGKEYFTFT